MPRHPRDVKDLGTVLVGARASAFSHLVLVQKGLAMMVLTTQGSRQSGQGAAEEEWWSAEVSGLVGHVLLPT